MLALPILSGPNIAPFVFLILGIGFSLIFFLFLGFAVKFAFEHIKREKIGFLLVGSVLFVIFLLLPLSISWWGGEAKGFEETKTMLFPLFFIADILFTLGYFSKDFLRIIKRRKQFNTKFKLEIVIFLLFILLSLILI